MNPFKRSGAVSNTAPKTEYHIVLPGVEIAFQHGLKIAFLYTHDPASKGDDYSDLESHLAKQGYLLVVIVAPPGTPMALPTNPFEER